MLILRFSDLKVSQELKITIKTCDPAIKTTFALNKWWS